jgi:hypothetical protein
MRNGDIGMQLDEIARANPGVAIGSYPFFDPQRGPNTNVVLRAPRGDAPDFVELGEAGIAMDDAMRRQRRVQLVG